MARLSQLGRFGPLLACNLFICNKKRHNTCEPQSPVDIATTTAIVDDELAANPLKFSNSVKLTNKGNTVQGKWVGSELSGGPLANYTYRLHQFHFHWRSADGSFRSEHTVDGKPYDAELHMVYWNRTNYKKYCDAEDKNDGIAVLGIFIKVVDKPRRHSGFSQIAYNLRNTHEKNSDCYIDGDLLPLDRLLPENKKHYWTYHGSLTTHPFYHSVRWIIFKEVLEVSKDEISNLQNQPVDGDCNVLTTQQLKTELRTPFGEKKEHAVAQN